MEGSQLIDGKFQPVRDICTKHAEDVFNSRRGVDTNPMIVQMIHHDEPVNHHYYRSDQWIDQPYKKSPNYAPPYVGPADKAEPSHYGEGAYIVEKELTDIVSSGNRIV